MHIFRVKIRFRYQYRINARFEKKKISESAPVPYSKNNKNGESTLVPYSKKTKIGESEPCASYDKDANSAISRCRFQALLTLTGNNRYFRSLYQLCALQ